MADAVAYLLIAVLCIGGLLWSWFGWYHWQYKRYAEWCWEWRDRSVDYHDSARRLLNELQRLAPLGHEVQFLQLLYSMDIASAGRTGKQALQWEYKIPRWCRAWYLKRYRSRQ